MFCVSTWLLDELHIFSYVAVESNPEVFGLLSHAEWRRVLSRCFSFSLAPGNLKIHESHVAGGCDDVRELITQVMSSCKLVSVTHCSVVVLCDHTHRSSKPASKTTTNNQQQQQQQQQQQHSVAILAQVATFVRNSILQQ